MRMKPLIPLLLLLALPRLWAQGPAPADFEALRAQFVERLGAINAALDAWNKKYEAQLDKLEQKMRRLELVRLYQLRLVKLGIGTDGTGEAFNR